MKKCELIKARITKITNASPRIKLFELSFDKTPYYFTPGQWIDLYAPKELIQNEKSIAGYTIISTPRTQKKIELAIRESNFHPVTQLLHSDKALNLEVDITEGQGIFTLKPDLKLRKPVFLAGGIGITPLLSMCRTMNEENLAYKLIYSVSYKEDFLLINELQSNPLSRFHFCVTKEKTEYRRQRIDLEYLKENLSNDEIETSPFFICGPKEMIDDLKSSLVTIGVPSQSIHHEKWW